MWQPPAVLPDGTVAFFLSDVEASTRLWERFPDGMRAAAATHDAIVQRFTRGHGGVEVRPRGEGDSRFCVFPTPEGAVAAAVDIQRALHAERWPFDASLRVRIGIHTGEADLRAGDYYGSAVNRCARLRAAGHGGQTLICGVTAAAVAPGMPPGVRLRDLGERRLKDLLVPERIYQLVIDGLPNDFPPIDVLDARPNNLPVQPTPLVGREREVFAVGQLLLDDQTRLVTLTGAGGTGKSRLAVHVAADVLSAFEGGVFLVPLADLTHPSHLFQAIASTLAVPAEPERTLQQLLERHLAQRRCLLVLDNFEHLLHSPPDQPAPAAAAAIASLLAACPWLTVLVTSRAPLRIAAEREFPLAPLAVPDPRRHVTVQDIARCEAVQLFLLRARAIQPSLTLSRENAHAIGEICRRLDGLPLAVELAASRVRLLPPRAMLTRLDRLLATVPALPTPAAVDEPTPPRHETLHRTVAWSYELLTTDQQTLLRWLSVFPSGSSLQAAEAVSTAFPTPYAAPTVIDVLEELVAHSLLLQHEQLDGEPRFTMLDTIRSYARDRLDTAGESMSARHAHAEFFLRYSAQVAVSTPERPLRYGPATPTRLDALERDLENFRAAARWLDSCGRYADAMSIVARLCPMWSNRGYAAQGLGELRQMLQRPQYSAPTTARAFCLWYAGLFSRYAGLRDDARTFDEQSLTVARQIDDPVSEAYALVDLGWLAREDGDLARARECHEAALRTFQTLGHRVGTSLALDQLARDAHASGQLDEAVRMQHRSLDVRRAMGHHWGIGSSLLHLGDLALEAGNLEPAGGAFREALHAVRPMGTPVLLAGALEGLAAVAACGGDATRAIRLRAAARTLRQTSATAPDRHDLFRLALVHERAVSRLSAAALDALEAEADRLTLEEALAEAELVPLSPGERVPTPA